MNVGIRLVLGFVILADVGMSARDGLRQEREIAASKISDILYWSHQSRRVWNVRFVYLAPPRMALR